MKKLILALALFTGAAHADEWLEAANKDGGKILLLTAKCDAKYPSLRLMMAIASTGQTVRGCWAYFSDMVHVTYDDGTAYTYDPMIFVYKSDNRGNK
jgi:hypothetical protein